MNAPAQLKTCTHCRALKPLDDFGYRSKARGTRRAHCLECNRVKLRAHYAANPDYYVAKAAAHNASYRERNQRLADAALQGQACAHCSATADLTFYQGPDTPHQPVHMAVHGGVSEQKVLDAIGRSTIVCRPCLGSHFISGTAFWQQLDSPARQALQAQREKQGFVATPHDYYKRYRPVTLNEGDA